MKAIPKAGLTLGVLVVIWTFITGVTGWYRDPVLFNLFWLVILIQIGVMIWGLRLTAGEGRAYGGQVGAGVLMSLIGGVIIFLGSLLLTSVVFPSYFADIRQLGEEMLRAQGMSEEMIKAQLDQQAAFQTPFMSAFMGFVGTLVTGLLVSLIVGAFLRKKPEPAAQP
jgi:TM2 domain-containing membrane protein YozV